VVGGNPAKIIKEIDNSNL